MQFVANGPDVPDALLQAHEEGRVVFFCGAGISYPAGLPGFGGLVESIYTETGTIREPIEDKAFSNGQYDATLNLLEDRLPGQRHGLLMRKALAKALMPKLRKKGATDTHSALLQLAKNRNGMLRLVTTNFDRVFELVAKRERKPFTPHVAPMLPVPKNSRWNGLVYLHGLLPDKGDESALNRLVVTSGDFGLAYLTERWAARFVSELFRNYVVCFVGYSINDPVMRYMMDALAADRMLGEVTPQAWALGDVEPGQSAGKIMEWKSKGVTPILYEVPAGGRDHSAMHRTLKAWAETYRDGVNGKERIVVSHAIARPSASTKQDDFVGRMLWALSDKSGIPAQRFAEFNPAPSLEWLTEAFSDERYRHSDLSRFGVAPYHEEDGKLQFSLIRRPAPYRLAPHMQLVSGGPMAAACDNVMSQLARWLVRHLNDPTLILWLADRGGQIGSELQWLIERALDRFDELDREGKSDEINEILSNAPNAMPTPPMRQLWRLMLGGRVKAQRSSADLYMWKRRLDRDGLTPALRMELRDLLSPRITIRKPYRWGAAGDSSTIPLSIRQIVDWEIVLVVDDVHSGLRDAQSAAWQNALPKLLDDLQILLRDALELRRELNEADEWTDRSYWDLSSISDHRQNKGFRDWVALIELLRDAWLATLQIDPPIATEIAQRWFSLPQPTFKRMALFAASHDGVIGCDQWVDWLVSGNAWWLWSIDTKREALALLRLQGKNLSAQGQNRLESAILKGPPREIYSDDIAEDEFQEDAQPLIWLRLAKLQSVGVQLDSSALERFLAISKSNPHWQIASDERDEFSHWMSSSGDPDYKSERVIDQAPVKANDLVLWLRKPPPEHRFNYEDTWRDNCRKHMLNSLCALQMLADEGVWPELRWREALQAWSEPSRTRRSWRHAAAAVGAMPEDTLSKLAQPVSWWLKDVSNSIDCQTAELRRLCARILALPVDPASGITRNGKPINQPVAEAINHPVGHVTQALLNLWFKRELNDNDRLPDEIGAIFTEICDTRIERFRHGRVLLCSQLIPLFRVDRAWVERCLLPLFNWDNGQVEARAAWEGFLWSPRLYPPLMTAFKLAFLQTADHFSELGEHGRQFASFITYAALEPLDGYVAADFRTALAALPKEGLNDAAQALAQALEGAGDQREDYWNNRVRPLWLNVWPKSRDLVSPAVSDHLARMAIAAGNEFPVALTSVQEWLIPIQHPDHLVRLLLKAGHCSRFAIDALKLLSAVIHDHPWPPTDLGSCLDAIAQAKPDLATDFRYQRLREYLRKRGG